MIRYLRFRAWFCLFLVLLTIWVHPFAVFADVMTPSNAFAINPGYLICSASNADPYGIATMELIDDDYSASVLSSISSIENTVDYSGLYAGGVSANDIKVLKKVNSDGSFIASADESSVIDNFVGYYFRLSKTALPAPGKYRMEFDLSSDISVLYTNAAMSYRRDISNSAPYSGYFHFDDFTSSSGDIYFSTDLNIENVTTLEIRLSFKNASFNQIGGLVKVRFTRLDSDASTDHTIGSGTTSADYEADVSGSLSDISSSIGDMSESLDSAAENLEYISTSQNLIIQGIDNVIMHISDQLYAFWDQLYNLIHEPTYARLEQILLALKAIANNSDISAVVDTIEETTQQQITNDNSNTSKVESAVEKHGNFIIEGLKGLFIPSDEYFKSYFDDLYTYFSDRFGFLSFPIDLLVRLVDLFVNSSDKDCILTLPEFEISGEKLITEASFNLTEFLENDFAILLSSIRLVTSIGLIMAFVNLCQDKWNEVMRN